MKKTFVFTLLSLGLAAFLGAQTQTQTAPQTPPPEPDLADQPLPGMEPETEPETQPETQREASEPATDEIQQNLQEILEEPAPSDSYRYDPQGRRDPFRSLIGPSRKIDSDNRPPGAAGFLIDEMDLQGVLRTQAGLVAMVNGPDNTGYLLRVGDKVLDGEVIRISADSVVFRQEVNDPTRIERFREVVKELSPQAESKKRKR